MSDSDRQWVLPALLVLVVIGLTTIGFAYPNSQRSPESIVDEFKNSSLGKTMDGWFPRKAIRPCAESPRPLCCVGERVEVEGMCMLAVAPGEEGAMRRVGLRTAQSTSIQVHVEASVNDKRHTKPLDWKTIQGNRVRATADFGPEPAALLIQCAKRCTVEFE